MNLAWTLYSDICHEDDYYGLFHALHEFHFQPDFIIRVDGDSSHPAWESELENLRRRATGIAEIQVGSTTCTKKDKIRIIFA